MARILIVEDEKAISMLLQRIVKNMGHEVATADEGGTARDICESQDIDLIMTDIQMPGKPTGTDLIRCMRQSKPNCPIVVVSGYTNAECMEECEKLGVSDFLPKPFEMGFVKELIANLLQRHSTHAH